MSGNTSLNPGAQEAEAGLRVEFPASWDLHREVLPQKQEEKAEIQKNRSDSLPDPRYKHQT